MRNVVDELSSSTASTAYGAAEGAGPGREDTDGSLAASERVIECDEADGLSCDVLCHLSPSAAATALSSLLGLRLMSSMRHSERCRHRWHLYCC